MKTCIKCEIEKEYSEFHKYKQSKDGYRYVCKICRKEEKKEYYLKNYDKISVYNTEYWLSNKDRITPRVIKWRKDNKDKVKKYQKKYETNNQEKLKKYRKENKHLSNGRIKKYEKNNPNYSIGRRLVRRTLKYIGKEKYDNSFNILGYTPKQLKERLECQFKEGMTWKNYGKWHVDHKKPLSLFDKETPIHIMNALCNLQPLWAKDNLSKNNKRIG